MARTPTPIGQHGVIKLDETPPGSKRWRARTLFRDKDGKTRQVERTAVGSKERARRALLDALEDRRPPSAGEVSQDTRLGVLAFDWLERRAGGAKPISPQTADRYRTLIERYIVPSLGGLRVRELRTDTADAFVKEVAENAPSQARHCRTVLSGMMSLAVRMGAADVNPIREVEAIAKTKSEVAALTVDELALLRRSLDRYQRGLNPKSGEQEKQAGRPRPADLLDVMDLLAATGNRIGEVLALRWQDVDLSGDTPTITTAGTIVYVKGTGFFRQDHPKTAAGYRTTVLPAFAVAMLLRRRVNEPPNDLGLVFPSTAGTVRSPHNFRRQWRDAVKGTEFEGVHPHMLRASVATFIDAEFDTRAAQEQLGHASPDVTRAHYIRKAHAAPDMAVALEALGAMAPDGAESKTRGILGIRPRSG